MIRELTHDHFDTDKLDLFWRFLTERQRIWVRRAHLQMDRPWTSDRALNHEFITNVYRELDPGTGYVLDTIAADGLNAETCFNIMIYRLMGSNVLSHSAIGRQHLRFKASKFISQVKDAGLANVFGDAYRVAGYERGELGNTKVENVGRLLEDLAKTMPEYWRRLTKAPNAKDIYNVFNNIEGFGVFLSNQLMVDLLMVDESRDERLWHFGTDEWCMAGPGAKRGIKTLLSPGVKVANNQLVMAWLRDAQFDEFFSRDLMFPFLLNRDDSIKRLSMCNIQTSLCEFHKYVRSRGQVKVRAYANTPSMLEPYDIVLHQDEIDKLHDITACTPPENTYAKVVQTGVVSVETLAEAVENVPERLQNAPESVVAIDLPEPPWPERIVAQNGPFHLQEHPAPTDLSQVLSLLNTHDGRMKPVTIPVDPTGLMGLPKAIVIVPIY